MGEKVGLSNMVNVHSKPLRVKDEKSTIFFKYLSKKTIVKDEKVLKYLSPRKRPRKHV
jgi:hypothetical protein